eukprot:m.597736 g.597736  ORF g.597736 m.597736 type:complete len:58 (+) comp58070_c0_seq6:2613-2786(+)
MVCCRHCMVLGGQSESLCCIGDENVDPMRGSPKANKASISVSVYLAINTLAALHTSQ